MCCTTPPSYTQHKVVGQSEGQSPLETSSEVHFKLRANNTRRVRWDTRLGLLRRPAALLSLGSLSNDGGLVPALDVVILRRYPIAYIEMLHDGTKIHKSAKEEERAAKEYDVSDH